MNNYNANNVPSIPKKSWRDRIAVHPAADMFPLMSTDELKALGEDIKKNGLTSPIVTWSPCNEDWKGLNSKETYLLDGRNRLDAMELVGLPVIVKSEGKDQLNSLLFQFGHRPTRRHEHGTVVFRTMSFSGKNDLKPQSKLGTNPYEYVVSANIHRRHLTAEQRIEVAEKLAKANPTMSARRIAKLANISPTTAVKAKTKVQETGDVSTVDTSISIDTKGRRQPAKKAKAQPETEPPAVPRPDVVTADGDRGVTLPEQRRIYDKGSLAGRAECVIEELDAILHQTQRHPDRLDIDRFGERLMTRASAFIELAQRKRPADDGFDIPPYLDRRVQS